LRFSRENQHKIWVVREERSLHMKPGLNRDPRHQEPRVYRCSGFIQIILIF
jgi:hypothetical protein